MLGIYKISTDILTINAKDIKGLFPERQDVNIDRPDSGEIECLIGFEYADFHPVKTASNGHLLLLSNRFGNLIGGTHNSIKEGAKKVIYHAAIHLVSHKMNDFFSIENLGIEVNPRCGSCRCGECHPGGKSMSLKEEREYNLIEERVVYNKKDQKWEASLPWVRDPADLPNNRSAALATLKRTEKRLLRNMDHARLYQTQIKDMIDRHVCRKLNEAELNEYEGPIHYITHREILKPESKSTMQDSF